MQARIAKISRVSPFVFPIVLVLVLVLVIDNAGTPSTSTTMSTITKDGRENRLPCLA